MFKLDFLSKITKISYRIIFIEFLISIFLILILILTLLKKNYINIYGLTIFNVILLLLFLTIFILLLNFLFVGSFLVTYYIEQALIFFVMLNSRILELFKKSFRLNLLFIKFFFLFTINFTFSEGENLPNLPNNGGNNTVETICLLIFFYLLGYSLGYVYHNYYKQKPKDEYDEFINLMQNHKFKSEKKPVLNSISEHDLIEMVNKFFETLNNLFPFLNTVNIGKFLLFVVIVLILIFIILALIYFLNISRAQYMEKKIKEISNFIINFIIDNNINKKIILKFLLDFIKIGLFIQMNIYLVKSILFFFCSRLMYEIEEIHIVIGLYLIYLFFYYLYIFFQYLILFIFLLYYEQYDNEFVKFFAQYLILLFICLFFLVS